MSEFKRTSEIVLAKLEDRFRIDVCECSAAERRLRQSVTPELWDSHHEREMFIFKTLAERKWWQW
jgi:hypothetical protein